MSAARRAATGSIIDFGPSTADFHGVDSVANQVDQNLLHLHAVREDLRAGPAPEWCATWLFRSRCHRCSSWQHFGNDFVQVHRRSGQRVPLEQRADPAHDFGRRVGVANDALRRELRALKVGRLGGQPTLAGMAVGDDGGERLIDLMGDRGRQFGQARGLRRMREPIQRRSKRVLHAGLFVDIDINAVPLDDSPDYRRARVRDASSNQRYTPSARRSRCRKLNDSPVVMECDHRR